MGIAHNGDNAPDLLGYEMKNDTTSGKTTFGDWSPNKKIWGAESPNRIDRGDFCKIFGHKTDGKRNRWSWSGKPVPRIDHWNIFGQTLKIDDGNDIVVYYNYDKDKRNNKESIIPEKFRKGDIELMRWTYGYMKMRVEKKFNQKGWFKCFIDNGIYICISFGRPFTVDEWLKGVRSGEIYLDSGMYHDEDKPNTRPYMEWRANNDYWNFLLVDSYPEQKNLTAGNAKYL